MNRMSPVRSDDNAHMYTPSKRIFNWSKMLVHSEITSGSDQFTIAHIECQMGDSLGLKLQAVYKPPPGHLSAVLSAAMGLPVQMERRVDGRRMTT